VPKIRPFRPLHYAEEFNLDRVTAPPYDVISPEERSRLASQHPKNFVNITLPEGSETERYANAAVLLGEWLHEGTITLDDDESFFVYRSDYEVNGRPAATTGIMCLLELERFGEGSIHAHEKTMPGPKADRLSLLRATKANLEPLWFIAAQDLPTIEVGGNDWASVTADGVTHRIWRAEPGSTKELFAAVEKTPLVVADGHHRYETSLTYRAERRANDGGGPWDYTLALISSPNHLAPTLKPTHRVLDGPTPSSLEIEPFEGDLDELAASLTPGRVGIAFRKTLGVAKSSGELDTEFLAELFRGEGMTPRYEHDLETVSQEVEKGATAFLVAPVPISLVVERALKGKTMPPKTTLFWPKPRSGLVFRLL
jgi:uncharacterized protein (DUF1015 family)